MIDVGDLDLLQQNVICSRYVFDVDSTTRSGHSDSHCTHVYVT